MYATLTRMLTRKQTHDDKEYKEVIQVSFSNAGIPISDIRDYLDTWAGNISQLPGVLNTVIETKNYYSNFGEDNGLDPPLTGTLYFTCRVNDNTVNVPKYIQFTLTDVSRDLSAMTTQYVNYINNYLTPAATHLSPYDLQIISCSAVI